MWDSFGAYFSIVLFFFSSPMCGLRAVPLRRLIDDKKKTKKKVSVYVFGREGNLEFIKLFVLFRLDTRSKKKKRRRRR